MIFSASTVPAGALGALPASVLNEVHNGHGAVQMKFLTMTGCAYFVAFSFAISAELGPNDYPFAKGEVLTYDSNRNPIRKGKLRDGRIEYTIHRMGGLIEVVPGWRALCRTDKITDETNCAVTNDKAKLSILYNGKGEAQAVCLMEHTFPGKQGAIRIDALPPHLTDEKGCVAAEVANEITAGQNITTRQVKFPNELPIDREARTFGLQEITEITTHVVKYKNQIGIREN